MKRAYLWILILIPSKVIAQTGNSQLGPLHLPFEFKINVNGIFKTQNNQIDHDSAMIMSSSIEIDWTVDTNDTNYHIKGDTILYSRQDGPYPVPPASFLLVFDSNTHSILNLSFSSEGGEFINGNYQISSTSSSVQLSNFAYDSSSIYTTDSSLAYHNASAAYGSWYNDPQNLSYPITSENLVSVSSMDLSGNFRPITLSNESGVGISAQPTSSISLASINGSLECSFPPSGHYRTLELYTPLGANVASFEIAPGQTELILPHLQGGLYFVRLDGAVLKIALP